VIHSPKHLILALRNTLQQLELTIPPEADQEKFAELKNILNHRIAELEECAAARLLVLSPMNPKQAADS
jgi:hypothetical protein